MPSIIIWFNKMNISISVYIAVSYGSPIYFVLIKSILRPLYPVLCTRYSLSYLIRIIPL
nr:MAG TPA: hypothetical protein [Bacteriophage sp.]